MKRRRDDNATDVLTPEQRSWCMSRIKGKDTKPELWLRRALWAVGLRYRIGRGVLGRPDVVFKKWKVALFVDGCFWHHCPDHGVMPKHNRKFWQRKIRGNVKRDHLVTRKLEREGWNVLRFWEHEIETDLDSIVRCVRGALGR